MERIKLTKKALNDFIVWSTSRYNDYCGYGNKKDNVDIVYNSLKNGCYTGWRGKKDESKTKFEICCSTGVGENGLGRVWQLKGRRKSGDWSYEIDCVEGTIKGLQSQITLSFIVPVRLEKFKVSNANEPMESNTEACTNLVVIKSVCDHDWRTLKDEKEIEYDVCMKCWRVREQTVL